MSKVWKLRIVSVALAAAIAGSTMAFIKRGVIYEALDKRPLPELQEIDYYAEQIDQTYEVFVQLPPGYDENGPPYPVMYATDGESATELYDDVVLPLIRQRKIPEIITVSIGYKDVPSPLPFGQIVAPPESESDSAVLNAGAVRIRDYAPGAVEKLPHSGHADEFLKFIVVKIIPFIDATYNTDVHDRCIAGHSLGGLFSFYAQLRAPDTFNRCISTSPSLFWANRDIFDREEAFSKEHKEWNTRLYLGAGSEDTAILSQTFQLMVDTLAKRDYANLTWTSEWHRGENHMSVIRPAITAGLEFVY